MSNLDALYARAKALNLHGLLAHWTEAIAARWVETLPATGPPLAKKGHRRIALP